MLSSPTASPLREQEILSPQWLALMWAQCGSTLCPSLLITWTAQMQTICASGPSTSLHLVLNNRFKPWPNSSPAPVYPLQLSALKARKIAIFLLPQNSISSLLLKLYDYFAPSVGFAVWNYILFQYCITCIILLSKKWKKYEKVLQPSSVLRWRF